MRSELSAKCRSRMLGDQRFLQKQSTHTKHGGQLASAFEAECEPAARKSPSEKQSIGLAGVPGTDPRLLWWQRGVDRPTMRWRHRGRRQEATITETIRSTIAGNLGASRREFPAPPSWGGETTYKNRDRSSGATRPGHPLVHPAGTPESDQNAVRPRGGTPSGCVADAVSAESFNGLPKVLARHFVP